MRLRALTLVMAAGLLGCGCGDSGGGGTPPIDAATSSDASAATCDVGTGYDSFVALSDGDPVSIIAGPQGGFHIFTSVRVRGFDAPTVHARVSIHTLGGSEYLGPGAEVGTASFTAGADGWDQAIGLINLLDDPATARGHEVVLRLEARDDRGASSVSEHAVLAQ